MTSRMAIALVALIVSACGGGGGGDVSSHITVSNLQYSPTAADARLGTITVSGSVDFVSGADIVSLRLTDSVGANSTVSVNAVGLRNGRVTIPAANIPGNPVGLYAFTVWLRDAAGAESNKLNGQIEIRRVAPQANAGIDVLTYVNVSAQLDGSASTNVNGTPTTYAWTMANPPAAGAVTLSSPSAAVTGVSCAIAGVFDVELRVNDGMGQSPPDSTALSCIPSGTFGLGASEEQVHLLTGAPNAVSRLFSAYYDWEYSDSLTYVRFSATTRRVIGWRTYNIVLPAHMPYRATGTGATRIAVGITKDDVARIQGTPLSVDDGGQFLSYEEWAYDKIGLTYIRFSKTTNVVTEYRNYDGSLKT